MHQVGKLVLPCSSLKRINLTINVTICVILRAKSEGKTLRDIGARARRKRGKRAKGQKGERA